MREYLVEHGALLVAIAFGVVLFFFVVAVIRGMARGRRRDSQIRDWAFRSGYDYQPGPFPARDLAPISYLQDADASNVARGSRVTLMDLNRTVGPSNDRETRVSSCALFKLAKPLPPFSFFAISSDGPDSLQGQLLGKMMGMAKSFAGGRFAEAGVVTIESRPGFLIRSTEPERVRRLFADDRLGFFDDKTGWTMVSEESWLLLSRERQPLNDATDYDQFVHEAQAIHDHFFHSSS